MDTVSIQTMPMDGETLPLSAEMLSVVKGMTARLANLTYKCLVTFNATDYSIIYSDNYSELNRRYLLRNMKGRSFKFLVEMLSNRDVERLDSIMDIIKREYKRTPLAERGALLFSTDMRFVLNEGINYTSYNFTPIAEDTKGNPTLFTCAISFSTGNHLNSIFVLNVAKDERRVYNLDKGTWQKVEAELLTPIEKSVLALSAQGLEVTEIAAMLHKAVESVRSARKRIFRKLGVKNITQAILLAVNHKII